ncbi:MAG: rhomboid family intramembrane serine protease, partial [Flavobacteriales bacterium]
MADLDFKIADKDFNQIELLSNQSEKIIQSYVDLTYSSLVGASGAIFGLLAGFALLFPNTELMLIFPPIPVKAKYLIGGYLAFEIYNSVFNSGDTIAHLAHVGG